VTAADVVAGNTQGLELGVTDAFSTTLQDLVSDSLLGVSGGVIAQPASTIKAMPFMVGARTLQGCLVPVVGTAPTNFNFVAGDYNRRTGLKGNAGTKYLDSNRANNADPQDNKHLAIYKTEAPITNNSSYIAAQATTPVASASRISDNNGPAVFGVNASSFTISVHNFTQLGFMGTSRSSSANFNYRANSTTTTSATSSNANISLNTFVFCRNLNGSANSFTDARLAFYGIGESLDLALLDARVTALVNAIAAAIP
jgi:hypothetical protein